MSASKRRLLDDRSSDVDRTKEICVESRSAEMRRACSFDRDAAERIWRGPGSGVMDRTATAQAAAGEAVIDGIGRVGCPRVSIVINTLNRAADLARTLESLRWLDEAVPFEVVVVNGPSTDRSDDVIAQYGGRIRAFTCPVPNLSVSRNLGIRQAAGDIVAFIDDDGIPEPEWLVQLIAPFADPDVGASGGFVFDHTGHAFQYRFGTADRLGEARIDRYKASPELNFPFTFSFPHLLGTNASFRRSALIEIGGFDEEFEYFLDETDVLARMVDAGYRVAQLPNAFVHHKFAPSHLRNHNRIIKNRYPVIKNKAYYCIKHGRRYVGLEGAVRAISHFFEEQRREVRWLIGEGLATEDELPELERTIERALERALERGLRADPVLLPPRTEPAHHDSFRLFAVLQPEHRRCLVLLSADYPPNRSGGLATLTASLATSLAALGHRIHVITKSIDSDRVDFEQGVWVHRIVVRPQASADAVRQAVPQAVWDWSATARDEVNRIAEHRRVDCIETPIWDCEGIAFLDDRRWPLVVSLQTTFHFWLQSHPGMRTDASWMQAIGTPMLQLERRMFVEADGIRAISRAIRLDIESAYDLRFDDAKVRTIAPGIDSRPLPSRSMQRTDASVLTVLFVGRLERRKGIDVLLSAIPMVLSNCPAVRFRIVGDNTLRGDSGATVRVEFAAVIASIPNHALLFEGRLDDTALDSAYADCDVFVGPSRYESFGLVYLEAMRAGKPVVACATGGVPEVVDDRSGILIAPDDSSALASAIVELVTNPALRARMGAQGRRRFDEDFTSEKMAERSLELYESCLRTHAQ